MISKKVMADIITKKTNIETLQSHVLHIEHALSHYRVSVKNSLLEEGYEYVHITFDDMFSYILEKLEV